MARRAEGRDEDERTRGGVGERGESTRRGAKRGARGGWSATKSRPAANALLLPLALLLRATREDQGENERERERERKDANERTMFRSIVSLGRPRQLRDSLSIIIMREHRAVPPISRKLIPMSDRDRNRTKFQPTDERRWR